MSQKKRNAAALTASTILLGAAASLSASPANATQALTFSILGSGKEVRSELLKSQMPHFGNAEEVGYAAHADEDKGAGEGKCGEGKCGDDKQEKKKETTTPKPSDDKSGEGKCGEGKCGE